MRSLLVTFALLGLLAATADARPRPNRGRRFESNKTFGLGLELGEPTGLTGKYFVAPDRAIDFGVGDIYHYGDRSGLHVYLDYLWHPVSLVSTEAFELPFYFGIGGRIWAFDYNCGGCADAYAFGVRVPVGISFDFNNVPIDLFAQFVFVLDFYSGYIDHHAVYGDLDFSIGARYYFN